MKRLLSLFLAILFAFGTTSPNIFAADEISEPEFDLQNINSKIVCELIENREEKAKFFKLDDGRVLKVDYPISVHKCDKSGNWQDVFRRERKSFVKFSDKENFAGVSRGNYGFSWKYLNLDKEKMHLEHEIKENNLKENLVLNSKILQNEFEIEYILRGLLPAQIDDKTIELLNENKKTIYTISAPVMFDSRNAQSDSISLQILNFEKNILKVKIICDKKWLKNPERFYPITIDPDYKDEEFEWQLNDGESQETSWRKKDTDKSIFLSLVGSDFKDVGVVCVTIFGRDTHKKTITNCTYASLKEKENQILPNQTMRCYFLEANRAYELYNIVNESECNEVALRFKYPPIDRFFDGPNQPINLKLGWSPDYNGRGAEWTTGKTIEEKDCKRQNCINKLLDLIFNAQGRCWTTIGTKVDSSHIYLNLIKSKPGHKINVKIRGYNGLKKTDKTSKLFWKNCTCGDVLCYTLETGKKYKLINLLKEGGEGKWGAIDPNQTGVDLMFERTQGSNLKKLEGSWSPDYCPEDGCIQIPVKTTASTSFSGEKGTPIREIPPNSNFLNVTAISQHTENYPTGCESTSATMLLNYLGCKITLKEFIDKYLPKKPIGENPDPNEFFVGNPSTNASYGCFAPCISKAINDYFIKNNIKFAAYILRNQDLQNLIRESIEKNKIPFLAWTTMALLKTGKGPIVGKKPWPKNEHCMVIIGQNTRDYFVCDPYQKSENKVRGAFEKNIFEERYKEQDSQAVVVRKFNPQRPASLPEKFDWKAFVPIPILGFSNLVTNVLNMTPPKPIADDSDVSKLLERFNSLGNQQKPIVDGTLAGRFLEMHFKLAAQTIPGKPRAYADPGFIIPKGYGISKSESGRPDFVLIFLVPSLAEVFELKSINNRKNIFLKSGQRSENQSLGVNQLDAYIWAMNEGPSSTELKRTYNYSRADYGSSYDPNGICLPLPAPKYEYHTFYLNKPELGMIYWKYIDKNDPDSKKRAKEMIKSLPALNEILKRGANYKQFLETAGCAIDDGPITVLGGAIGAGTFRIACCMAALIKAGAAAVGSATVPYVKDSIDALAEFGSSKVEDINAFRIAQEILKLADKAA